MTRVIYYTSLNHKNPIDDFLNSLNQKQQSKILRVFQSINDYGLSSALPHVKKLTGTPLWEIRILGKDNIRILYILPSKQVVLVLHGFIKKTQKTSGKEIKIAIKRFNDYLVRIDK